MQTLPALYALFLSHPNLKGVIVALTDDNATPNKFLLGNFDANISEGQVLKCLTSKPSIKQSIDPIKGTHSRATCGLTFTNIEFRKNPTTGANQRLSEVLTRSIINKYATVYFINTSSVTSLSDCVIEFSGKVDKINNFDMNSISITLKDNGDVIDRTISTRTVSTLFGSSTRNIPSDTKDRQVPVVFGKFTPTNGLVKVNRINVDIKPTFNPSGTNAVEYVICDHAVKKISGLYVPIGGTEVQPAAAGHIGQQIGLTYSTVFHDTLPGGVIEMIEWYTINSNRQSPFNVSWFQGDHSEQAHDLVSSTSARVTIGYAHAAQGEQRGHIVWELDDPTKFRKQFIEADKKPTCQVEYQRAFPCTSFSTTQANRLISFFSLVPYGHDQNADRLVDCYDHWVAFGSTGSTTGHSNSNGLVMHTQATQNDMKYSASINGDGFPVPTANIRLGLSSVYKYGDIIPPYLMSVAELRLKLRWAYDTSTNGAGDWSAFAGVEGRKYGSWISSLNTPSYNFTTSDCIEDISHIIASLLIDYSGLLSVSDLDLSKFQKCYNGYVKARLVVDDKDKTIRDVIQDLLQQAMCMFCFTASGKACLVPIRAISRKTGADATISYWHLDPKSVKVTYTDTANIVNKLIIKSGWHEELNKFTEVNIFSNTASQIKYGVRMQTLEFKNISNGIPTTSPRTNPTGQNDPIVAIGAHLIDHITQGSDGLLSETQPQVEFSVDGMRYSHLEIGDVVALDAAILDAHLKQANQSFGASYWQIIDIDHSPESSKFKVIKTPNLTLASLIQGVI